MPLSYLYIPDKDSDSIYTDNPQDREGYFFWDTWFNPSTGAFFRVAEIDEDLVRVSAVLTIPEDQRAALLAEIQQDDEESPLWAEFLEEVDQRFVEEWDARLARYDGEQGYQKEQ